MTDSRASVEDRENEDGPDRPDRARRASLGDREQRVHDELYRLDPRLAGLFVEGLGYLTRLDEPAAIHMLSHAGREISNAVIRHLTGEGVPISPDEGEADTEQAPRRDDSQRRRIALVLDLPPQHPSVTAWVRAHNALQGTTHFGSRPPSPAAVDETAKAFRALTDILLGRIGLYFEARAEIEALLRIENPSEQQVARLQALAARPQLRHSFFRDLRHVGWLEPLALAGQFADPPDARTDPDTGQVTAPPWPEAAYLERVAPDAGGRVVEILRAIPDELSNPVVWRDVADVALRLPPDRAAELVPSLRNALSRSTHPMVSRGVFAVADMLAKAENTNALELIRALLRVEAVPDAGPFATSPTGRTADLPGMAHTARPAEFLALIESTARIRAKATLAALCNTLNAMLVIEFGEPAQGANRVDDHSGHWHGHIEDDDDRSTKSLVTAAVLRAALVAAASEDAGADYALDRLSRYPWLVFERLRFALLAERPVFDQEALDSAIGNADLLNEPRLLPEYRQLLQNRLAEASPDVRADVIERIRRGPEAEYVRIVAGEDPDIATSFGQEWQRHRLRVFDREPPAELRELATELGTIGEVLSKRDRDLDRHGFAIEVGVGGGPTSPLSAEDLAGMTPDELVDYLRDWTPVRERNAPTPAGLGAVVAARVRADSTWAAAVLDRAREADIDPTYLRAALDGLVAAHRDGLPVPWAAVLEYTAWLVSKPAGPPATGSPAEYFDNRDPGLDWARRVAADLLTDIAQRNSVPPEHRDRLWKAVEALILSGATWVDSGHEPNTMEGVLGLELNDLAGRATHALLEVALADYRAWKPADGDVHAWPNRDRLRPLLDVVLAQSGDAALAARSALGRLLPQIILIDPEWLESNRETLFDRAIAEPLRNPTFATYVVRAGVYGQAFERLRWLYEEAVTTTSEPGNAWTSGPESFRPGRHLLWHLVVAYTYGWLDLETDAAILDAAFTNADADDSAHVWWQIFRDWSDSDEVDADFVERITRLLRWRLDRLEEEGREQMHVPDEAKGMAWLAMADRVSDDTMLPLLLRAVRLSKGDVPIAGSLWERFARMAAVNIGDAVEAAVLVIEAELRGEYPHFNFDEVAPVLRIGLASEAPATRELARRAVHKLGESGFEQFGTVLG